MIKVITIIGGIYMEVIIKPLSPYSSNGYILYEAKARNCFIIDPGEDGKSFVEEVEKNQLHLKGIILTHHHSDHCGGVKEILAMITCDVMIGEKDAKYAHVSINKELLHDETIYLGEEPIQILNTPGHTEGGIVLICEKDQMIFTGDTLFAVEIGRTDLYDGSPIEMKNTMQNIVDQWDDRYTIYPGHDKVSTMKNVRVDNKEFLYAMSL